MSPISGLAVELSKGRDSFAAASMPQRDGRKPSARPTHRINVENEMIKRREKEMKHQLQWNGQVKYYQTFEKSNNKFESWTSPRYYESSTQQWQHIQKTRTKEEMLEKRREKLKKLLQEEEGSHQIELMVKNRDKFLTPREKPDDIPVEVLKEVNSGLKLEENERKRHEAELNLYHQWRSNNPVLRHYERMRNIKDTKLSWLDQQIEKRMDREKSEEDCRKMLAERDNKLKEEKLKEEQFKREIRQKNEALKRDLEDQISALEQKQKESDNLKEKEEEELAKRLKFLELEDAFREKEKVIKERETALYNLRQHKQKLKQKAIDVRDKLKEEKELIEMMMKYEIVEQIEEKRKREELKETMRQFLEFAKEQEALEKQRQKYFDSLFDSESKAMFDKQNEIWRNEESSRKQLLEDVLASVREQIEENFTRNKMRQKELLKERENVLKSVEACNEEMEKLKRDEVDKQIEFRRDIDVQIRDRSRRKRELELLEQRNIDRELDNVKKEEERLKNEILKLQMQGPNYRRTRRSKIFY